MRLHVKGVSQVNLAYIGIVEQQLRLAMGEVDRGLETILEDGDQNAILDRMQHRRDLYDLLRYEDYNRYDRELFNFRVGDTPRK